MTARKVWTKAEILAHVRHPGVIACMIVYGVGETKAYELLRHPEALDFRVIKIPGTNRCVVPTTDILRALSLDDAPAPVGH